MDYKIKYSGGHVEVYDKFGRFLFSADTMQEALVDITELAAA